MANKLSELMTETGNPSQTSFANLVLDDLGEPSTTGISLSNFLFTAMSWSPSGLTLTIDPYIESDTATLSRVGSGGKAQYCNTNTLTLTKLEGTPFTNDIDRLTIKKGAVTVVSQAGTAGNTTLDNASTVFTMESADVPGTGTADIDVNANYVGAFNGTVPAQSDLGVRVTDNTTGGGGASFIVGTPILMADGTEVTVENIMLDDILKSGKLAGAPDTDDPNVFSQWESETLPEMTIHESYVDDKLVKFVDEYYLINNIIGVTKTHYIFVKDSEDDIYRWKLVNDIVVGDKMIDFNSNEVNITSKILIKDDNMVVTLDVEQVDTYFAHGVLVYNAGL